MKKLKGTQKKLVVLTALIVTLMICIAVGSTSSFLKWAMPAVINIFDFGSVDVDIVEPGVDPDDVLWSATSKPVEIKNPATGVDSVVRVMLVPQFTDKITGDFVPASFGELSAPVASKMVLGDITLVFASDWSTNWFFEDGFFYYNKVLLPGETTPALLAGVTLTTDTAAVRAEYANTDVKIEVLTDALQAQGGAPADAWGRIVNLEAGTVS